MDKVKLVGYITLAISILYSPFWASLALTRQSYFKFFAEIKYLFNNISSVNYALNSLIVLVLSILVFGSISLFFIRRKKELSKKHTNKKFLFK